MPGFRDNPANGEGALAPKEGGGSTTVISDLPQHGLKPFSLSYFVKKLKVSNLHLNRIIA
jgi:hypothetical protein